MLGRKEEAEVIIRLDQKDSKAHVCVVAWPAMLRKMTKLHGESLDGADPLHSARWIVPIRSIRIRGPYKRVGKAPTDAFLAARVRENDQFGGSKPAGRVSGPSETGKPAETAVLGVN